MLLLDECERAITWYGLVARRQRYYSSVDIYVHVISVKVVVRLLSVGHSVASESVPTAVLVGAPRRALRIFPIVVRVWINLMLEQVHLRLCHALNPLLIAFDKDWTLDVGHLGLRARLPPNNCLLEGAGWRRETWL